MTVKEVQRRVEQIREVMDDDEIAHIREDALRRDVLLAIANGSRGGRALARETLATEQMDFARWCA